jgi:hypothetical protein
VKPAVENLNTGQGKMKIINALAMKIVNSLDPYVNLTCLAFKIQEEWDIYGLCAKSIALMGQVAVDQSRIP